MPYDQSAAPVAPPQPRVSVVIADDHPLILDGVEHLLQQHADFEVVASCRGGAEAIAAVRRHDPDVLLADLKMLDMSGVAVARELQQLGCRTQVVLLTAQLDEDQLIEALRVGVRGVVLKEMTTKLLVDCLRRVHAGGQWLEKDSAARAMAKLVRREARAREIAQLLTPREIEVVRLVAEGLSNREVADRLFIAEGTVKIHLHNVYEKAKVTRRTELVRFASEYGLV